MVKTNFKLQSPTERQFFALFIYCLAENQRHASHAQMLNVTSCSREDSCNMLPALYVPMYKYSKYECLRQIVNRLRNNINDYDCCLQNVCATI